MNLYLGTGRLTRDPEQVETKGDKTLVNFSIAINDGKDKVTFVNCKAFDYWADRVLKHFVKGDVITVQGPLRNETWTDKESGQERRADRVIIDKVYFVPGSAGKQENVDGEDASPPAVPKKAAKGAPKGKGFKPQEDVDDDIPF